MNDFNMYKPTPTVGGFGNESNAMMQNTLNSLSEAMGTNNLDYVGDIKSIILNRGLSESYKDILLEDYQNIEASDPLLEQLHQMNVSKMEQLMENATTTILNEAGSSNLNPIVGLTFPLLKYNWIENVFKDYFHVEIATTPIINRQIERIFLQDSNGNKYMLPDAFNDGEHLEEVLDGSERKLYGEEIPMGLQFNLLEKSGGSMRVRDEISRNFRISEISFKKGTDSNAKTGKVNVNIKPDAANCNFTVAVSCTVTKDGQEAEEVQDMLSGSINYMTGMLNLGCSAGYITGVKVKGSLSSENNLASSSVGWETRNKQFVIPVGRHLNTGLTVERMQDEGIIYKTDAQAKAISNMTMVLNQIKDGDMLRVLNDSKATIEGNEKLFIKGQFNCDLDGEYALTKVEYRSIMLKEELDKMAEKLKRVLRNQSVFFAVVGHPDDIRLLKDINWQFTDGKSVVGGTRITYSFGLINADHKFLVLSSAKCKKGALRVIVRPMTDDQISYIHFDYTFAISNNYRDPNMPNVPSVMTTQRYLTDEVVPVQGYLEILNNK